MTKPNPNYQSVFDKIYDWLKHAKDEELKSISHWVSKADEIISAAEELSVNEYQLSVADFKQDLLGFYQQYKDDADNSLYLTSIQEGMWQHLAKMTDQSQVEWAELVDDFEHDGVYQEGDVIGFGQLICQSCDHEVDILHASTVVACTKCGHTKFTRKAFDV